MKRIAKFLKESKQKYLEYMKAESNEKGADLGVGF